MYLRDFKARIYPLNKYIYRMVVLPAPVEYDVLQFSVPSDSVNKVAVYYFDNNRQSTMYRSELLLYILGPGEWSDELSMPGSSFVLRSADLVHRVRITIFRTNVDRLRPYRIAFESLSIDDRDGNSPLELQHSDTDYVWLDPFVTEQHFAARGSLFIIRDKNGTGFASLSVLGPQSEIDATTSGRLQEQQQLSSNNGYDNDATLSGSGNSAGGATTKLPSSQPASSNMIGDSL